MLHEAAESYGITPAVTPAKAGVHLLLNPWMPVFAGMTDKWRRAFTRTENFIDDLKTLDNEFGVHLTAAELKAVVNALGERDETAEICRDRDGNPEPDAELRDTETVPLKESIEEYFKREVLPHVPDAWIDESKTKVGYEIPLNRHFYRYEPPRPLEDIEADIKTLESDILALLKEVAA